MTDQTRNRIVYGAIGSAIMTIAERLGCNAIDAHAELLDGLDAVPREKAEAEAERLREALRFYADTGNDLYQGYQLPADVCDEFAARARSALDAEDGDR